MHIVDGTFGAGGYSHALISASDCNIIAFDKDPAVFVDKDFFGHKTDNVTLIHESFAQMQEALHARNIHTVDGIVLDLGVSSMQIDQPMRGFSFLHDGPLDMRMNTNAPFSAAELVNTMDEAELADILYLYGEERKSRRIAKNIVTARMQKPFTTTFELKETIHQCFSGKEKAQSRIDVATRSFQAIRIAVNHELEELEHTLEDACALLNPSGRLAVVSFHSLEDRIVKHFMNQKAGKKERINKYRPTDDSEMPEFSIIHKKAIIAQDDEVKMNPRSRSAKLRVLQRNTAPKNA